MHHKADVAGARAIASALREVKPDVVHAQDRRAALACSFVRGVPLVATFHGVPDSAAGWWVEDGPLAGKRIGWQASGLMVDALVLRRMRAVVAPSRAMAAFLVRRMRVPAGAVHLIHNGVALPLGERVSHSGGGARVFTSVGSFAAIKAMPALVQAFLVVAGTRPELRLRLVGDGDDRRKCEELARAAGLQDRVDLPGYRTDVPAQLAQADAFVLPSVNENLPLALLEAMAAGLPCIASRVGAIPELMDETNGMLVSPGDGPALERAMATLADDGRLAQTLGQAGARRVEREFSIGRCADGHIELWQAVAGASRR